jgi:sigma-B regulation protein RsbQ
VGAGNSDLDAFSPQKYSSLQGYADDVLDICRALELRGVIFVGHSVSAMIGVLASARAPELFEQLVLVGPSPRYIDDADYVGGFSASQIEELLEFLDTNHMGTGERWPTKLCGATRISRCCSRLVTRATTSSTKVASIQACSC